MSEIVGIDIGSYALKMVAGKHHKGILELSAIGSAYNPVGQFLPNDPASMQKLAVALKQLLSDHKLTGKPVYVGLPESVVYTSVITLPYLSEAELSSSIHWEAEQHIPVPLEEVNLEYEVLYKPKKGDIGEKMRVLLVAAKKDTVTRVVELFHLAGADVIGMETLLLAVYRALTPSFPKDSATIVCHMGALSTDLLLIDKGNIVLTYTIQSGGLALTRAVEKSLGLPPSQAEEYKRTYGLDSGQLEGKIRAVLTPVLQAIVGEIRKAMQYYQISQGHTPLRTMILSGGSAYLPALGSFITEALSLEVLVANPFGVVSAPKDIRLPEAQAVFSPVVGLALRNEE